MAQIITAINCGYDVSLLVVELLDFEASKQKSLIEKYQIDKKIIIEDYKIPKNKFIRLVKWLILLVFNFKDINYIIPFYRENTTFSLTWLYQWVFYKQFNEVSIFHVQYGTNSGILAKLKKIGYKPSLIVSFHGHDAFFPINGFIPNNGYYDNLFKYGDLIVANTPYLANTIAELGCPKELITTVPVGVDTDFFYPKKTQISIKKCKLISVGRLSIVKGHIYAFESVRKLEQGGYNIELTVVGEGPERVKLENYIRKNNLFDSIVLVGAKSQEEVRELLWESNIFLFPSVSLHNGKSTETQGLATIEAMACGLPAVVFDSGGVKYTIDDGKTGFICNEYDINDLVYKIELLYNNKELLKSMSQNTVDFVNKNYSQKVIDAKWEIIYRELSNGK
ncbi:glycosyltransferase family 4 protein [Flavobacterium sp. UMI-01]|uniref:glycosyltransferase family 4 protein n=1 Tax=Flavobacterium sp. UMI-01 TaxID=1441053 RepID=UPI001C7CB334|nr:glycosyltransferase family 4 protein [Flavobacterium sp. UMI-01]